MQILNIIWVLVAYGSGEEVDIDVVEGMKWMKLASENGFPHAIKFLES